MKKHVTWIALVFLPSLLLCACGNNVQTTFFGKIGVQKLDEETIKVIVNPCGAPITDVRFQTITSTTYPNPSKERFSKRLILDSPKSELFELTYSISPNATNSFPIFTKDLGEFNIHAVAQGVDSRTSSVYATRSEIIELHDGEILTGTHKISDAEKFEKCAETFKR